MTGSEVSGNFLTVGTKRGRPSGLLLNSYAVEHLLGDRPQVALARQAKVASSVLSELMAGNRGASPAMANRIAAALDCHPAVVFPELATFTVAVRYFTASGVDA